MGRGTFIETVAVPFGALVIKPGRGLRAETVRVPLKSILYQQAMAENGRGDLPKPVGPAPPFGFICYQQ